MPITEQETQETGQQEEAGTETEFGTDGQPFDATRAQALIAKLRSEAKQASKALKELDQLKSDRQKAEDEKLSEQERLAKELEQTKLELKKQQKEYQDRSLDWQIQSEAAKRGLIDPEIVARIIDRSELDFDANGKVTNLEAVLKELAKAKPFLVAGQQQQQTMNPTNPSRAGNQQQEKPVYTRAQFSDYKYYQAHRDEMMLAMKEGRVVDG